MSPAAAPGTKPFWQSTTLQGLFSSVLGFAAFVIPIVLPKITSADITHLAQLATAAIGSTFSLIGFAMTLYGRLKTDNKKLTLT